LGIWDIMLIIAVVVVLIGVGLYFLYRWSTKKQAEQHNMVQAHKQSVSIYVIDKKKDKLQNAGFPKAMADQIPRMSKLMKMPLVKAKIGPQIMTLMCDKDVYEALPLKKTVNVEIAGAYIVSMKGQKTKREMAEIRASRRRPANEAAAEKTMSFMDKVKAKLGR